MTENPQPPSSNTEKLLAELEAERQKRIVAGAWTRATLPMLQAIVDGDETDEQAMERALAEHLAEHPTDPKTIAAYDWIVRVIIGPKPVVELPGEQFDQPDTRDVSPAPYRPPMPSPPRASRSLPPAPGAGALSADPARMNIPARIHDAEQRRTRNFNGDTWGDPSGWPIRYPRGNRNGW